jgi:hypothetical protein
MRHLSRAPPDLFARHASAVLVEVPRHWVIIPTRASSNRLTAAWCGFPHGHGNSNPEAHRPSAWVTHGIAEEVRLLEGLVHVADERLARRNRR